MSVLCKMYVGHVIVQDFIMSVLLNTFKYIEVGQISLSICDKKKFVSKYLSPKPPFYVDRRNSGII